LPVDHHADCYQFHLYGIMACPHADNLLDIPYGQNSGKIGSQQNAKRLILVLFFMKTYLLLS
jgi:hypothetical protein